MSVCKKCGSSLKPFQTDCDKCGAYNLLEFPELEMPTKTESIKQPETKKGDRPLKKLVYGIVIFFAIVIAAVIMAQKPVQAEEKQPELRLVDTTGYYDYLYHLGVGYDGRPLVEGLTIAGKKEWLGYSIALYDLDYKLIGIYEVRDIGYGKSLGWKYGASAIRKGSPIGDIEAGLTLDLYFNSKQDALNWGRRKCYMQLIKAVG